MYRSSVYDVLFGAVFALIALRYSMAEVDPANILFTYYNSLDSPGVPVVAGHKNERHTVYIISDWNEKVNESWIQQLKNTTLSNLVADVIIVDWSRYYGSDYTTTCQTVPGVGKVVGDFAAYSTNLFDTQMQGYGMGALVASNAGKRVQVVKSTDNKIVRIVALEPSKDCSENLPVDKRLVPSDAMGVLVFHTTENSMSYISGTAGVFFNYCKRLGLLEILLEILFGISSHEQPGCSDSACSSLRAVLYFIESIKTQKFLAVKCDNCSSFLDNSCPTTKYVVSRGTNDPGRYYLNTKGEAPWYIEE